MNSEFDKIKIAVAQIAPIWLNKEKTRDKIKSYIIEAGKNNCNLLVFGEALLPGYPFWLSFTDASKFNSKMQKEMYAYYLENAVRIENGDLDEIKELAKQYRTAIYLGIVENPADRGGHSLYCSLVYINAKGEIESVHRKLQPTYEERLVWAQGDGNGLQVHQLKKFCVGGLNCWENWMPLSRTALYAMGENLHVAVWPGAERNTIDSTRFIAKEARSFVVSASGIMRRSDIPKETPYYSEIIKNFPDISANGGSCVSAPDGNWLIEPFINEEKLLYAELDFGRIAEERQNFDPVGHYSRPDVTTLLINRERQSIIKFDKE